MARWRKGAACAAVGLGADVAGWGWRRQDPLTPGSAGSGSLQAPLLVV